MLSQFPNHIRIAHRGTQPENRMTGFANAARAGCHMIECDIRLSKDDHPMVIHDKTINRTTPNGKGSVSNMARYELEKHNVPSFQELTQWISEGPQKNLLMAVELKCLDNKDKNKFMVRRVVEILETQSIVDRSILISFDKDMVKLAKESCQDISTAIILPVYFRDPFQLCDKYRSDHLWMYHRMISRHLVEKAKKVRKKIFAWTVNDPERIRTLCDMGVDGIVTDYLKFFPA